MWQSPSALRFNTVSSTRALPAYKLGVGLGFTLRWRPAVLNVPSPNQGGRDVNLISHAEATALEVGLDVGRQARGVRGGPLLPLLSIHSEQA